MKRRLLALCAMVFVAPALPAAALEFTGNMPDGQAFGFQPDSEYAINFTLSTPGDAEIVITDTVYYSIFDTRNGITLTQDDEYGYYSFDWTGVTSGSLLWGAAGYQTFPDPICPGCIDIYDHSYMNRFFFSAPQAGTYDITIDRLGATPEPSEWALLLAGFATLGVALRRRRAAMA